MRCGYGGKGRGEDMNLNLSAWNQDNASLSARFAFLAKLLTGELDEIHYRSHDLCFFVHHRLRYSPPAYSAKCRCPASQPRTADPQTAHQEDADGLRDDLKKMRALCNRWRRTWPSWDTTQSPLSTNSSLRSTLKTVIDHMEKRLNSSSNANL